MNGRAYLGAAGAAIALALAAYALAGGIGLAERPRTVTAEYTAVSESVGAEGSIRREQEYICCDGHVKLTVSEGERVARGAVIGKRGKKELRSPAAGFFSSSVGEDAPDNAVGKVVSGLTWYYEAELDCGALSPGDAVTLRTEYGELDAEVREINGRCASLCCRSGVEKLLGTDTLTAQVIYGEKSGYRVPASALCRDGDGEYVTVLAGGTERRAAVSECFEFDDCCLVKGDIRQGMEIIMYN